MKKLISFAAVATLCIIFLGTKGYKESLATCCPSPTPSCGTFTYEFGYDGDNSRVEVDFENDGYQVDVDGINGWTVINIWLDEWYDRNGDGDFSDDANNWIHVASNEIFNYNPSGMGLIDDVRVEVTKACPSPSATPTQSATPTATATSTATATASATPEPSATPTDNPNEPTPTPTEEPTATPLVCSGTQHLDAAGKNCVDYSYGGSESSSSSSSSGGQVLGASTMAGTGSFAENLYLAIMGLGATIFGKGLKTWGKLLKEVNRKPQIIILFGLFLFLAGASRYYSVRVLSFNLNEAGKREEMNVEKFPVKITIPSIEIDLKVDPAEIKNGVWDISYQNATFLASSEVPKSGGNTIIYGHNKKAIFGNLPYLSIGQKIILEDRTGKKYEYEVYKKDFVKPDRIDLVSPTDYEELTLFTCFGLLDSQRAVTKAKPIK